MPSCYIGLSSNEQNSSFSLVWISFPDYLFPITKHCFPCLNPTISPLVFQVHLPTLFLVHQNLNSHLVSEFIAFFISLFLFYINTSYARFILDLEIVYQFQIQKQGRPGLYFYKCYLGICPVPYSDITITFMVSSVCQYLYDMSIIWFLGGFRLIYLDLNVSSLITQMEFIALFVL